MKTVPADLSKLSNLLDNDFGKTMVYDKLFTEVNAPDTTRLALKTQYNIEKSGLENKISDTNRLVKKTDYNAKITETEVKTPSITVLATTATLNAVENKIPNISNLIKKQILMQKYQTLRQTYHI